MAPRLLVALALVANAFADVRISTPSAHRPWSAIVATAYGFTSAAAAPSSSATFHEFALHSIPHCPWARAFYQQQRTRHKGHHAAVRALAFKWMRILFRCWKNRSTYDEPHYLRALALHHPAQTLPAPQPKSKKTGLRPLVDIARESCAEFLK